VLLPPLAEVSGETAPAAAAAAAATAAAGEDGQEIAARVARRASSGPVAAGRGARLRVLPLTTAVSRLRWRERLLEASGQHFVDQGERHSSVGCPGAVNSPPAGVGGQNLRGGRPMLGCEEVTGRDDLAQREGTEPALNEAVKPAQVQKQLGGRVRDQLVGAVRQVSTAGIVDVAEERGDDEHLPLPANRQDPFQVGDGRRQGNLVSDDDFTNHVVLVVG